MKPKRYEQRFRQILLEALLMGRTVKTVELKPRGAVELTFEDGTTALLKISKGEIVGKEIQQEAASEAPAQAVAAKQRCQARVTHYDGVMNIRGRIPRTSVAPCSRGAAEQVGHLHLCKAHARMCRQGFVDPAGEVTDRATINDYRRLPEKFRSPFHNWLPGADPRSK